MRLRRWVMVCAVVEAGALWNQGAMGSTVWTTGANDVTFIKFQGGDPILGLFQDHITGNVWLTRADTAGLFNARLENGYDTIQGNSPVDTQWAFSGLHGNPVFTYGSGSALGGGGSLSFTDWTTALGGVGQLQGNIKTHTGVIHLLTDDIFLDVNFTEWGSHGDGRFTYTRAGFPGAVVGATWDGSVGNWTTAAKWTSAPNYPDNGNPAGAPYNVTIGAGTVTLDADIKINTLTMTGGTLAGSKNLTVNGGTISGTYNVSGATEISGGTLEFSGGSASSTLVMGELEIAGVPGTGTGKLNLTKNNLIVGTGWVADQIKQGAALGSWTGTGGITSSAAAAAATGSTATALAYATGADYTIGNGQTLFAGQSFLPTDTLVMYTLAGDGNMDGSVTFADFLQLQNNYNKLGTNWEQGDWNYDGSTTFADFLVLQNNYNKVLQPGNLVGGAGSVPEAGSIAICLLGLGGLVVRRRRG